MRFIFFLTLCASAVSGIRAADTRLAISPSQSRIEIAVHTTVDSFLGRLNAYEPEIFVDEDGEVSKAQLAFHFRDVSTGKESRDKSMHEWQQTGEFPDGIFTLTSMERSAAGPAIAFGRLTFHGVTRDVRFPIAIARAGSRYVIDGDVPLDTREFGLPVIRMLALLKVDPLVHVRFHLQATREMPAK